MPSIIVDQRSRSGMRRLGDKLPLSRKTNPANDGEKGKAEPIGGLCSNTSSIAIQNHRLFSTFGGKKSGWKMLHAAIQGLIC